MAGILGRVFSAISALITYQILASVLNLNDIIITLDRGIPYPLKMSASQILIASLSLLVLFSPRFMMSLALLIYLVYVFPATYLFKLLSAFTGLFTGFDSAGYSISHVEEYAFILSSSYLYYYISNISVQFKGYIKKLGLSTGLWLKSAVSAFLIGVLAIGLSIASYLTLKETSTSLNYPLVFLGAAVIGIVGFLSIVVRSG